MATFAYSGRTRAGETITGERIAETIDAAVAALRREQILVTTINPVKEAAKVGPAKPKSRRVNPKNLAVFVRQFSVFSNLFLVAALLKTINAPSLQQVRASKEILLNELGVIYRKPGQLIG